MNVWCDGHYVRTCNHWDMCMYVHRSVTFVFPSQALKLNGQKLFGVPIMIQPTMAEKNR